MVPILAGILIIGLVYVASISESIFEWITMLPIKLTKEIKKTLVEVGSIILQGQIESFCDNICAFLTKLLKKQIDEINHYDKEMANIFKILIEIATPKDFASSGNHLSSFFSKKVKLKMKSNFTRMFIRERLPFPHFAKIGFILMLCFASFMMRFHYHRQAVKYDTSKVAEKYDEEQNPQEALEQNRRTVPKDNSIKIDQIELTVDESIIK